MDYFNKKVSITLKDPIIPKQIKFMFVGDSDVGKTSIVKAFVNEEDFLFKPEPTNSVDLYFKKFKIKEGAVLINLNIWDFSGVIAQPKIRSEFYAELHAIIYVFDLNNSVTFNNLENWIRECKRSQGEKLIPVLLGNKSDLKKEVTQSMIEVLTEKYKLNYYEVSIKDLKSIKKFFLNFSNNVYELRPKERNR